MLKDEIIVYSSLVPSVERDSEPSPEPTFEPTPEPTQEVFSEEIDYRAVYDGDVSDSILRKLSAYYNDNAQLGQDYVILRESQYVYVLAFGDEENHHFTGTIVRYTSSTYTADCTVSVSRGTYYADLSGDTGYIYSSCDGYLPSAYISKTERYHDVIDVCVSACFFILLVCVLLFTIFGGLKRR